MEIETKTDSKVTKEDGERREWVARHVQAVPLRSLQMGRRTAEGSWREVWSQGEFGFLLGWGLLGKLGCWKTSRKNRREGGGVGAGP